MYVNYKHQIEDLIMENRQLREQLIFQLVRLKQLCGENHEKNSPQTKFSKQRNNSSSSVHSSTSDISRKSDETFVISNSVPSFDERIYLEMQFEIIKDDIMQSFHEYYEKIERLIKDTGPRKDLPTSNINSPINPSACNDFTHNSFENMSRLQKEIFQLRKRITDYECIIQSKDSMIETAIQQRIKRGSLVPEN